MNETDQLAADVLVVGAGIAGASVAFQIAEFASVVILEQEGQCGYHSTGRSAASFTENYGTDVIRRLAIASRDFLARPPPDFADHALLGPRGMITIGRADQLELMRDELRAASAMVPSIVAMDPADAVARVPILRPDYVASAIYEPFCMEIDVHGLHHGFLRAAKRRGATLVVNAEAQRISRAAGRWHVSTPAGTFSAALLVNAAGAWADSIAVMAGIAPLNLVPKRRTAFNVAAPAGSNSAAWPMVNDVGDELYFKPTAGLLMVSPSDATPWTPSDVQPDEEDVALGIDRLERMTTLSVQRIAHRWAGLRTFASDGSPVVGPDSTEQSFVWLAGQGGYGIKTSPALSRACAGLIRDGRLPQDLEAHGLSLEQLSPARLRQRPFLTSSTESNPP